jgi:hypothetical protein
MEDLLLGPAELPGEVGPHGVVQVHRPAWQIEVQERSVVKPLYPILGVELVRAPQSTNRRKRDIRVFGKDGEIEAALALLSAQKVQAHLKRAGDGLVALARIFPVEGGYSELVKRPIQLARSGNASSGART